MSNFTRIAALGAGALALAACDIVITPDRVEEGTGDTITVTPDTVSIPGYSDCVDEATVSVYLDTVDADPVLLGTTTSDAGDFTFEFPAPAEAGAYQVYVECDRGGGPPGSIPGEGPPVEGSPQMGPPEELVVEPEFAPAVTPASYVVGSGPATVVVQGSWCVNSTGAGDPEGEEDPILPLVTATLGEIEQTVEALIGQPFTETWEVTFDAPTEPGTYPIAVTCDYLDLASLPSGPSTPETRTAELVVEVDGVMESSGESIDEGDALAVDNADSSPCVEGVVTVTVLDGETEVASATPDVAGDGSWSAEFADLDPGDYTIAADCARETGTGPFGYEVLSASVVGTPTTTTSSTTTAPPPEAAPADTARPVVAQPRFTG